MKDIENYDARTKQTIVCVVFDVDFHHQQMKLTQKSFFPRDFDYVYGGVFGYFSVYVPCIAYFVSAS